ncbi:MAG: hypothetical protein NTW49_02590 [Bacteroidia bacterium]|nr:hypothetical protein [Bacteroidia bacterium]
MHKENFVVDISGKRIAVILPIADYDKLIEAYEELKDIKAYDKVKTLNEPVVPLHQTIKTRINKG